MPTIDQSQTTRTKVISGRALSTFKKLNPYSAQGGVSEYSNEIVISKTIGNVLGGCCNDSTSIINTSTVPDAPTNVSAVAGNREAIVTFTAPTNNGGSPIISYRVVSSPGGITSSGGTSPITITGLTPGTTYTFTVIAVNSIGDSLPSSSSNSITTPTVPDAPTNVSAEAGDGQATVSFTPPLFDGGLAITSYTVTSSPGGISSSGTGSPIIIPGLANGTSYTFSVVATNDVDDSLSSDTSNSVTPMAVPTITGSATFLILGDTSVDTVKTNILNAKTALNYGGTLTITTQQLNGYTGSDLSSYDLVIIYTNGNLSLNATLGDNLDAYVASGKHLIMFGFSWGNVSAISNFDYNANSTYVYYGTNTPVNTSSVTLATHPLTNGLPGNTGVSFTNNIISPITLTSGALSIGDYTNGTSFIAVKTVGSAKLIGINIYPYSSFDHKFTVNSIYWAMGYLV